MNFVCRMTLCFASAFLMLSLALHSAVFAHTGHDHGDKPTISLPDVVAKVNGHNIPKDAIVDSLVSSIKKYKAKGMPLTGDQEKIAAKKLIDNEINRQLLLASAGGIVVSAARVDARLKEVKSGFKSEAAFDHKLKDEGLSIDQYRKELEEELKVDAFLKKELGGNVKISDADVDTYYQKHQTKYTSPEMRRASVMLIKVKKDAGPDEERRAQDNLQGILDKVRKEGDFAKLVKKHSQDTLASRGGDLGYFQQEKMFKPFSQRAFKLKVGEISDIFRTRHGFQVLKLTGIKPAVSKSEDHAKKEIRDLLLQKEIKKKTPDFLTKLKKDAKIKVYF